MSFEGRGLVIVVILSCRVGTCVVHELYLPPIHRRQWYPSFPLFPLEPCSFSEYEELKESLAKRNPELLAKIATAYGYDGLGILTVRGVPTLEEKVSRRKMYCLTLLLATLAGSSIIQPFSLLALLIAEDGNATTCKLLRQAARLHEEED